MSTRNVDVDADVDVGYVGGDVGVDVGYVGGDVGVVVGVVIGGAQQLPS